MARPHRRKRWIPKAAFVGKAISDEDLAEVLDSFEIDYGSGTETTEFMVATYVGNGLGRGVDVDVYDDLTGVVDVDPARPVRHRWAGVKILELFPMYGRPTWSDYTLWEWLTMDSFEQQSEVIDAARAYIDESGEHTYEEWISRKDFEEIRSQW